MHAGLNSRLTRSGLKPDLREGSLAPVPVVVPWTGTYAQLILTTGASGEHRKVTAGGEYVYRTEISAWIANFANRHANGNLALVREAVGDVLPSAETVTWDAEVTANGGTVTSDATKITFDTVTSGSGVASAYASDDLGSVGSANMWLIQGDFQVISVAGTNGLRTLFYLRTTGKTLQIDMGWDGTSLRLLDASELEIGTVVNEVDMTTERFVEGILLSGYTCGIITDNTGVYDVSIDYADLSAGSGGAAHSTIVGDFDATSGSYGNMTGMNIKIYRLA